MTPGKPTPRTDAALKRTQGLFRAAGSANGFTDFARQLERENTQLDARAEKAEKLWKEFITLMEITEESDSGYAFNPNKISSCRAMDGKRLNEILNEARQIVFKQ